MVRAETEKAVGKGKGGGERVGETEASEGRGSRGEGVGKVYYTKNRPHQNTQ